MSRTRSYSVRKQKGLTYFRLTPYSVPWKQFRTTGIKEYSGGIGASEISTIVGYLDHKVYNEYETRAKVFNQKVGLWPLRIIDNLVMWHGRYDEDKIQELWQCYDGTEDGYMAIWDDIQLKKAAGEPYEYPRRASRVNEVIVNDKYPHLFASLDRRMNKGSWNWIHNRPNELSCPLEFKTMNNYVGRKWKDMFPIQYFFQLQQQMMVFDADYAELAILEDGRNFRVIPFERHEPTIQYIEENSEAFWKIVLEGREVYRDLIRMESKQDYDRMEICEKRLSELEPGPDTTMAYMEFLAEKSSLGTDKAIGRQDQFKKLYNDKVLKLISDKIDKERQLIKNDLTHDAKLLDVNRFEFEGLGEVRFSQRKNAKVYTMNNKIKFKIDDDIAEKLVHAMIDKYAEKAQK
jgi:hypothetical protein